MQRALRGKSYVFEGELPEEVALLLEKWGKLVKRGEVAIYSIEQGEIKIRKISESPTKSVRRIYINPACGCVLEIDESRDFEEGRIAYALYKKRLCPEHQA
ncbi:hypothetical protein [Pyrobaculum aerophilum]|uniref:Uncharacterized protein n=1 Tax=Pyrobaculum aerophilum TaxID=13773 RepID=A0A371R736_9CREN|nr:hypothetical protein [Pyrobaculum aerophilum]RFA92949.1 hypothetical protein CGL51_13765 [Pyrobaculum aerophilum]RFB00354.1 hypothetical protein CGL52_00375 [Pyrobaculum aerophilum]